MNDNAETSSILHSNPEIHNQENILITGSKWDCSESILTACIRIPLGLTERPFRAKLTVTVQISRLFQNFPKPNVSIASSSRERCFSSPHLCGIRYYQPVITWRLDFFPLSRWQLSTQESRWICSTGTRETMSLFRKCSASLTVNISSIGSWTSLNKTENSRVFRRSSPGYPRSADIFSSNNGMRFPQKIR